MKLSKLATCSLIILIFFGVAEKISAATFIDCHFNSPPTSENQGGTYLCDIGSLTLFFGSNLSGPVFDHVNTEGWNGSGAAKIYTHVSALSYSNSYRQMNPSAYTSNVRQNIRYIIKLGPGMAGELGGKWHIKEWAPAWRSWISHVQHGSPLDAIQPEIAYNNTVWMAHGGTASSGDCSSNGYQCCHLPSTWTDSAVSSCLRTETRIFDWSAHENQWVALELERNNSGVIAIYIWTQDGEFNGKYYEVDTVFNNDDLGNSPIGAYLEGANYTGKYFIIDEVKYSDSYIGPPPGFVSGTTPVCGDRTCNGTETCSSCPGDCGTCPDTTPPAAPTGLSVR